MTKTILGVPFFTGTAEEAVQRMLNGGLLVVPAAPALKDIGTHGAYREALLHADLVITDSAFMVLVWNLLERDNLRRVSGLKYLRLLLDEPEVRNTGNTLWIMAGSKSADRNLNWLRSEGINVPDDYVYNAPMYGAVINDQDLLERLERLRPKHIVVTIGGGNQERLGHYLRQQLSYVPGIHCIGAAIAFLSGDQVHIPEWADQFYLGWLFRVLDKPKLYFPRYISATSLFGLLAKYRSALPPLEQNSAQQA
ncbi:WecB/TagA/CpsF family glycosyltransferase [Terriglobus tenax]|uniref:WecB/TagA/CpsF family glycosyltransferase n=1 Tax=Terriglobus tenax TaxID=1111115 RepID=UPI0021DF78DB|nr:WecB/TagA/CpsF family glycosyltransferase [Terriglobus tenax]